MMNETEWKAQRKKAQANYELKKMLVGAGRATAAEVEEARRIFDALKAYQPEAPGVDSPCVDRPAVPTPAPKTAAVESAAVVPGMPVPEFTKLLEELTIERQEYHKQMCLRSNRLGDYPDETNLKDLVDEIQEYKAKRNAVAEKIAYLKANGRLPATPGPADDNAPEVQESAFLANLPADRYELNKLLVNSLMPKLYRAKKGLAGAESELWKAHYRKEMAKAKAAVDAAKRQLSAMA
ncbi:hypothetical protein ACO2Q8_16660 [Larkinella sp. VNQ87]|uniref:hypothetical protein n=1 Tax=Larkinella sp. VNQ87 TaxID=3400921 RepID=UPI003C0469E3